MLLLAIVTAVAVCARFPAGGSVLAILVAATMYAVVYGLGAPRSKSCTLWSLLLCVLAVLTPLQPALAASFIFTPALPLAPLYAGQSLVLSVRPSSSPLTGTVQLSVYLDPASGGSISPASRNWSLVLMDPQNFTIVAPTNPTMAAINVSIIFALSGSENYTLQSGDALDEPAPALVQFQPHGSFALSPDPSTWNSSLFAIDPLYVQRTRTVLVTPSVFPTSGTLHFQTSCSAGSILVGGDLTWTSTDRTPKNLTFRAPYSPAPAVTISYLITGTFTIGPPMLVPPTSLPFAVILSHFNFVPTPPAFLFRGQSLSMGVTPADAVIGNNLKASFSLSGTNGTGSMAVPANNRWDEGEQDTKIFVYTAPTLAGSVAMFASAAGPPNGRYADSPVWTIAVGQANLVLELPAGLTFEDGVWTLSPAQTISLALHPSWPPRAALNISCNMTGGATLVPAAESIMTLPLNSHAPFNFTLTAPNVTRAFFLLTCGLAAGNTYPDDFVLPAPVQFAILSPRSNFTMGAFPAVLDVGQLSGNISLATVDAPTIVGDITLTPWCAPGSDTMIMPPSLTFAVGSADLQSFEIRAPSTPQTLLCFFTLSGPFAALQFNAPSNFSIIVIPKASFLVVGLPPVLFIGDALGSVRLTPNEPTRFSALAVDVFLTLLLSNDTAVTSSVASFVWPVNSTEPFDFTPTLSSTELAVPQTVNISFVISGSDAEHYLPIATQGIEIIPLAEFELSATPSSLYEGQPFSLQARPLIAPFASPLELRILCLSALGQVIANSTLVFVPGSAGFESFNFSAPSASAATSLNVTFAVLGDERHHYITPAEWTVAILPRANFTIDPPLPSFLYANQLFQPIAITSEQVAGVGGVTVLISCNSSAVILNATSLFFSEGEVTVHQLSMQAVDSYVPVAVTCDFAVSGPDQAHFLPPASLDLMIRPQASWRIEPSLNGTRFETDTPVNVSVYPSEAAVGAGVTLNISCISNLFNVPRVFSMLFNAATGLDPAQSTRRAAQPQTVVCTFSSTGDDVAHFRLPDPAVLVFLPRNRFIFSPPLEYVYLTHSLTTQVSVDAVPVSGSVNLTIECDTPGLINSTLLTFTPSSMAQGLTFTPNSTVGDVVCLFIVGGDVAGQFLLPPPLTISVRAQSTFNFSRPFPVSLYKNELVAPFLVAPAEAPNVGGVVLTITCIGGEIPIDPVVLSFAPFTTAALPYVFDGVHEDLFSVSCVFDVSGADSAHYIVPSGFVIPILPLDSFSFSTLPSQLYANQASELIAVQPSGPPAIVGGVTMTVHCGVGSIINSTLFFALGSIAPLTFQFIAPILATVVSCDFSLSPEASAAQWIPVPSVDLVVLPQAVFEFVPTSVLDLFLQAPRGNVTVSLSEPADAGGVRLQVTCSDTADGAFNSTLEFASHVPSVVLGWPGPPSFGLVSCSFVVDGPDAAHFAAPPFVSLNVSAPAQFLFFSSSPFPLQLYATETAVIDVGVDHYPKVGGVTLHIACNNAFGQPTGSLSNHTLHFAAGASTLMELQYTAPSNRTSQIVTCSFAIVAGDVESFVVPEPLLFNITAPALFVVGSPPLQLYGNQLSTEVAVQPSSVIKRDLRVLLVSDAAGTLFDPLSLDFVAGAVAAMSFSLIAPDVHSIINLTISFSLDGLDATQWDAPAPFFVQVLPRANFTLSNDALLTQVYTDQLLTQLSLSPSELPSSEGVALHLQCSDGVLFAASFLAMPHNASLALTYLAPSAPQLVHCSFVVTGADRAHFRDGSFDIDVLPRADFTFQPALPSTLYVGQRTTNISVGPSEAPVAGVITMETNCSVGVFVLDGSSLAWSAGDATHQPLAIQAGPLAVSVLCTFTVLGIDSEHYNVPSPLMLTLQPQSTFNVSSVPALINVTETASLSIAPATAPGVGGVNLTVHVSSGSLVPSQLFFAEGELTAQSVVLTAPSTSQHVIVSFELSGADLAHFVQPADQTFLSVVPFNFTFAAVPTTLYVNEQTTIAIGLTGPAPLGVTLSVNATNATLAAPSVAFAPGSLSAQLLHLKADNAVSSTLLQFTVSGPNAALYGMPSPVVIRVLPQVRFVFPVPFPLSLYANEQSSMLRVQPEFAAVSGAVALAGNVSVGVLTPASFSFAVGNNSAISFTISAPATAVSLTLALQWTLSGAELPRYVVPTSINISVLPQASFSIQGFSSSLYSNELSNEIVVTPTATPLPSGVVLTVSFVGAPITAVQLNFTSLSSRSFRFRAPMTNSSYNCSVVFSVSGSDAAHFASPSPILPILLRPQSSFAVAFSPAHTLARVYSGEPSLQLQLNTSALALQSFQLTYRWSLADLTFGNATRLNESTLAVVAGVPFSQLLLLPVPSSLPLPVTNSYALRFAVTNITGPGAAQFIVPYPVTAPLSLPFLAYPALFFGPNVTRCACVLPQGHCNDGFMGDGRCTCDVGFNGTTCAACARGFYGDACTVCPPCHSLGGSCDAGMTGDGRCVCRTGWVGANCSSCAPSFFGPTCAACPGCVYGSCIDGLSGNGTCACQPGYRGALCNVQDLGGLAANNVPVTANEGTLVVIQLNATFDQATLASTAFKSTLLTLPVGGSLYQTFDGVTPATFISAAPVAVLNVRNLLIYAAPAFAPPAPGSTPSTPFASFHFSVSDTAGTAAGYATVRIVVPHTNLPPRLLLPSQPLASLYVFLFQNTPANLSAGAGVTIAADGSPSPVPDSSKLFAVVSDPDAGSNFISISLWCPNGTFVLRSSTPVALASFATVGSDPLRTLQIRVDVARLNQLLSQYVLFVPQPSFIGLTRLWFRVSDEGNSGAIGGVLTVESKVSVLVQQVNQPITLQFGPAPDLSLLSSAPAFVGSQRTAPTPAPRVPSIVYDFAGTEDVSAQLQVLVADPDAYFGLLLLQMDVLDARTLVPSTFARFSVATPSSGSSIVFTSGSGRNDTSLQLQARLPDLISLLSSVVVSPAPNFNTVELGRGPLLLRIRANDQGNTGDGGPTEFEAWVVLNFAAVDDAPIADSAVIRIPPGHTYKLLELFGSDPDQLINSTLLVFTLTRLPGPSCALLHQSVESGGVNKRGALIDTAGTALSSPSNYLWLELLSPSDPACLQFQFVVSQPAPFANLSSNPGIIQLNVPVSNRRPQALDQAVFIAPQSDFVVQLRASDVDALDILRFQIVQLPGLASAVVPRGGGRLFQFVQPSGASVVLTVDGRIDCRGPEIRLTGSDTQLTDALGRVVYAPDNVTTASTAELLDSFSFQAVDSAGAISATAVVSVYQFDHAVPTARSFEHVSVEGSVSLQGWINAATQQSVSVQPHVIHFSPFAGPTLTADFDEPPFQVVLITQLPLRGVLVERDSMTGLPVAEIVQTPYALSMSGSSTAPLLSAFFFPDSYTSGDRYANFSYGVFDARGIRSEVDGVVSISIAPSAWAPTAFSDGFLGIGAGGADDICFRSVATGSRAAVLSAVILTLPVQGNLSWITESGAPVPITTVPYAVNDTRDLASIFFFYVPTIPIAPPFVDTIVFAVDGRQDDSSPVLRSNVAFISLLVGASSLAPVSSGGRVRATAGLSTTIQLNGTSTAALLGFVSEDSVKAIITALPANGVLRQMNGDLIATVPTLLLDPTMHVLYTSPVDGAGLLYDAFAWQAVDPALLILRGVTTEIPPGNEAQIDVDVFRPPQVLSVNFVNVRMAEDSLQLMRLEQANDLVKNGLQLTVKIVSLPTAGALYLCVPQSELPTSGASRTLLTSSPSSFGAQVTAAMLPLHVPAATCNMGNSSAGVNSTSSVWYAPPPFHHGLLFDDFFFASFKLQLEDPAALVASSEIASVNTTVTIRVTPVGYPPRALSASVTVLSSSAPVILTLAGQSVVHNGPVDASDPYQLNPSLRAWVVMLPLLGALYQVDSFETVTEDGATITALRLGEHLTASHLVIEDGVVRGIPVRDPINRLWYAPFYPLDGADRLEFSVFSEEEQLYSEHANLNVTVTPVQLPPLLPHRPVTVNVTQGHIKFMQLRGFDPESAAADSGSSLQLRVTSLPSKGRLFQVHADFLREWFNGSLASVRLASSVPMLHDLRDNLEYPAYRSGMLATNGPEFVGRLDEGSPFVGVAEAAAASELFAFLHARRRLLSLEEVIAPFAPFILSAITSVGQTVSNPDGVVVFVPEDFLFSDDMYSAFSYSAVRSATNMTSEADAQVSLRLLPRYQLPVALDGEVAGARENLAVVLTLDYILDPSVAMEAGSLGRVSARIEDVPSGGSVLCELGSSSTLAPDELSPCGPSGGARLTAGSSVLANAQGSLRLMLLPPLDLWGTVADPSGSFDSFTFTIADGNSVLGLSQSGGRSNPATMLLRTIEHVNQRPRCTNLTLTLTSAVTAFSNLTLNAYDPDQSRNTLSYRILSLPPLGFVRFGSTLLSNSTLPRTLPAAAALASASGPALSFDASSFGAPLVTEAGSGIYGVIVWEAIDSLGLVSNTASVTLRLDCSSSDSTQVANVWSNLEVVETTTPLTNSSTNATITTSLRVRNAPSATNANNPLCMQCPSGASCSASGRALPNSLDGFWMSDLLRIDQPVFLPCTPSSACLAASYESVFLHHAGAVPSQVVSVVDGLAVYGAQFSLSSSDAGCASGYTARVCSSCARDYYKRNNECIGCSPVNNLFVIVFGFGVPIVCVLAITAYILARYNVETIYFSLAINFAQTVATFQKYKLHWPRSATDSFSVLSVLNLDLELLSVECSLPELVYRIKWSISMVLPLILAGGFVLVGLVLTAVRASVDLRRLRKQQRLGLLPADFGGDAAVRETELRRVTPSAGQINEPSATTAPVSFAATARAGRMRRQSQVDLLARGQQDIADAATTTSDMVLFVRFFALRLSQSRQLIVRLYIILISFLFLPLTMKALEILNCVELADGSRVLVAEPALKCTDPWYPRYWRLALLAIFGYSLGVLLLFGYILLCTRPLYQTVRLRLWTSRRSRQGRAREMDSAVEQDEDGERPPPERGNWREYDEQIRRQRQAPTWKRTLAALPKCHLPASILPGAWARWVRLYRTSSIAHGARYFNAGIAFTAWSRTYRNLLKNYRANCYPWSLLVYIRLLALSLIATQLTESPLQQAALAIVVLLVALSLNLWVRPYKHADLNSLENLTLSVLVFMLVCGIVFFDRSSPTLSTMSTNGMPRSALYPNFDPCLLTAMHLSVSVVALLVVQLLVQQVVGKFTSDKVKVKMRQLWCLRWMVKEETAKPAAPNPQAKSTGDTAVPADPSSSGGSIIKPPPTLWKHTGSVRVSHSGRVVDSIMQLRLMKQRRRMSHGFVTYGDAVLAGPPVVHQRLASDLPSQLLIAGDVSGESESEDSCAETSEVSAPPSKMSTTAVAKPVERRMTMMPDFSPMSPQRLAAFARLTAIPPVESSSPLAVVEPFNPPNDRRVFGRPFWPERLHDELMLNVAPTPEAPHRPLTGAGETQIRVPDWPMSPTAQRASQSRSGSLRSLSVALESSSLEGGDHGRPGRLPPLFAIMGSPHPELREGDEPPPFNFAGRNSLPPLNLPSSRPILAPLLSHSQPSSRPSSPMRLAPLTFGKNQVADVVATVDAPLSPRFVSPEEAVAAPSAGHVSLMLFDPSQPDPTAASSSEARPVPSPRGLDGSEPWLAKSSPLPPLLPSRQVSPSLSPLHAAGLPPPMLPKRASPALQPIAAPSAPTILLPTSSSHLNLDASPRPSSAPSSAGSPSEFAQSNSSPSQLAPRVPSVPRTARPATSVPPSSLCAPSLTQLAVTVAAAPRLVLPTPRTTAPFVATAVRAPSIVTLGRGPAGASEAASAPAVAAAPLFLPVPSSSASPRSSLDPLLNSPRASLVASTPAPPSLSDLPLAPLPPRAPRPPSSDELSASIGSSSLLASIPPPLPGVLQQSARADFAQ